MSPVGPIAGASYACRCEGTDAGRCKSSYACRCEDGLRMSVQAQLRLSVRGNYRMLGARRLTHGRCEGTDAGRCKSSYACRCEDGLRTSVLAPGHRQLMLRRCALDLRRRACRALVVATAGQNHHRRAGDSRVTRRCRTTRCGSRLKGSFGDGEIIRAPTCRL